jgi:hypothetical protein
MNSAQDEYEILRKRIRELEHERDLWRAEAMRWKADHGDMVKRAALLRQRDDLPVDRIPAYAALVEAQTKLAEYRASGLMPVGEMLAGQYANQLVRDQYKTTPAKEQTNDQSKDQT